MTARHAAAIISDEETAQEDISMRAAVIGAGLAGMQAARALLDRGGCASVTIYERENEVGGVWRKNYCGYGAQVPRRKVRCLE